MPNEPRALAIRPPDVAAEDDYLALCAALSQNARGRAFLDEHARRSRSADTETLLAAITRIETLLKAEASAAQRLRDDLRMLVSAIRLARPEADAANPSARAAKLAKLLDLMEQRIDAMSEGGAAGPVGESISAALATEPEPTRARLIVLPLPDEPEAIAPEPEPEQEIAATPVPAAAAAARPDPLAAIMALSEEERLALFM